MEWLLSPQFIVQMLFAAFSAGGMYYAVKFDLQRMHEKIDEEKRLREMHTKEDDESFHDIRGQLGTVSNRLALVEGRLSLSKK